MIKNFSRDNGSVIETKRLLGVYYTPDNLAKILVRWAVIHETGTVLDPSFGRCAFLTASVQLLAEQGVKEPGRLVFGVDVDADCIAHVRGNNCLVEENCLIRDFLALSPEEVPGAPFKAIVGNPPYVRHHWLKGLARDAARSAMNISGFALPARASTWAYFLIHALGFLEEGGRLAMLVPEASSRLITQFRFERLSLVGLAAFFWSISVIVSLRGQTSLLLSWQPPVTGGVGRLLSNLSSGLKTSKAF